MDAAIWNCPDSSPSKYSEPVLDPSLLPLQPLKLYLPSLAQFPGAKQAHNWLSTHFAAFGPLLDSKVLISKRQTLYGFVTFASEEFLAEAISTKHTFKGRKIEVQRTRVNALSSQRAKSPQLLEGVRKLFVGGLPHKCSPAEFRDYWLKFGEIEEICFPVEHGLSAGFGFVTFKDKEAAEKVFMQDRHTIRGKWLDVKVAVPRRSASPNSKNKSRKRRKRKSTDVYAESPPK